MSVCLSLCLSVSVGLYIMSVYQCLCLSICLSAHIYFNSETSLFIYLFIYYTYISVIEINGNAKPDSLV